MAATHPSFSWFGSYTDVVISYLDEGSREKAADLVLGAVLYSAGRDLDGLSIDVERNLNLMKPNIQKSIEDTKNGKKGGRPKKQGLKTPLKNPPSKPGLETEWNGVERNGMDKERKSKSARKFAPPSLDEVKAYAAEKGITIDAQQFIDYYTANGWKVGRNPMKDWRATVRNWSRKEWNQPTKKEENLDDYFAGY